MQRCVRRQISGRLLLPLMRYTLQTGVHPYIDPPMTHPTPVIPDVSLEKTRKRDEVAPH